MTDLLAALGATAPPPETSDGWYTTRELCRLLGLSNKTVIKRLNDLNDAGRLEHQSAARSSLTGAVVMVPTYRLLD